MFAISEDNMSLKAIFWRSLRMYFAPLVGAIDGACKAVERERRRP